MSKNKKETTAATMASEKGENIQLIGTAVNPIEFERILDHVSIVTEIGEPEPIKHSFSSKEDDDDQLKLESGQYLLCHDK
jgi:hypothetical protein